MLHEEFKMTTRLYRKYRKVVIEQARLKESRLEAYKLLRRSSLAAELQVEGQAVAQLYATFNMFRRKANIYRHTTGDGRAPLE